MRFPGSELRDAVHRRCSAMLYQPLSDSSLSCSHDVETQTQASINPSLLHTSRIDLCSESLDRLDMSNALDTPHWDSSLVTFTA